jgi:hypothetical protein
MKKTKKKDNSSKKESSISKTEHPKEDKEDRTGLLNLKNDEMIAAITQTRKKKSTFKPEDITPEEELEPEEPETKETLEETVEEEFPEQELGQSYNKLKEEQPFSYDSTSSSTSTDTYNAGQSNTSSRGITNAYEGTPPGSYEGTNQSGGAYAEGTSPNQGQAHTFYNPENPEERVGEIRQKKSTLETTSQETAREQKKGTFKPQRY